MNLLSLTYPQLVKEMGRRYGRGAYHAAALYRAFYRTQDLDPAALEPFTDSPALSRQVAADLSHCVPQVVDQSRQEGVTKLAFALQDGLRIETVVIPMANHATICISCQVGCRMGCGFCTTGQMGFARSLTAAEIVAQVYAVKVRMGVDVRNVVFMGMGEPLDNFDHVVQAIRVLEDQRGLDIAKRHMTLSTAGPAGGIGKLVRLGWPQLKLAVSLNAADDALRDRLMPVNRKFPLAALKESLRSYPLARGNALFMEYVLIRGVNDDPSHARRLADYFKGLSVKLNLIAYNPQPHSAYASPSPGAFDRFHQALIQQRIFVRVRSAKGTAIRAACGQLGSNQKS